jgi:hypothetical protein
VRPNLLFAQQISNICCFAAQIERARKGKSQISLIKKGHMEEDIALHFSNNAGVYALGRTIAG